MGDTGLEHPSGFLNTQLVLKHYFENSLMEKQDWKPLRASLFGLGLVSPFSEPFNTACQLPLWTAPNGLSTLLDPCTSKWLQVASLRQPSSERPQPAG